MPIGDLPSGVPGVLRNTPPGMAMTPGALGEAQPQPPERPGLTDAIDAHFSRDNLIVSAAASEAWRAPTTVDPTFDAWAKIKGTDKEAYWDRYTNVRNQAQFDAVTHDINRELEARKIIDATPWWESLPLTFAANVLDPTILIPGGAFVRGAKGGLSVARSALNIGLATGAAVSVQEAGLQETQQLRSATESAAAIGGSVLLGGLLGAAGARLMSRAEWRAATEALDREINNPAIVPDVTPPPAPVGAAVGAQVAPGPDVEALSIAGRAARLVAKPTAFLNPGLRLMRSPSGIARDIAINTFEMTQYLKGFDAEMASPQAVETLRKEWNAGLMKAVDYERTAFSEYRKRAVGPIASRAQETVQNWFGHGVGALDRGQFSEAVGKALRRGDQHEIPEVANAAAAWRANVYDPLKNAAIEAGLLPEDVSVETAVSYFSRMYNRQRLVAEEHLFKNTVSQWMEAQAPRWVSEFEASAAERIAKASAADLKKVKAQIAAEREAKFEDIPGRARDIANEVYDKLTGRASDSVRPYSITVQSRGPLLGRTFLIPDTIIERWLESNSDLVGRRYQRIMSADIELKKKFGSVDMADQIKAIREDYAKLRNGVTDEKRLKALTKAEGQDVKDISGIRDLLRGTYDLAGWEHNFGRIARSVNMLNYIRSMGQVTIASLPEAYRTAMVHGMRQAMATTGQALRNPKAFKMAVGEAKLAGNITDRVLASRLATLAEIENFYTSRGPVEKFMANMVEVASSWNGVRLWTDSAKMIASVATQNRVLDSAVNWLKTAHVNRRYLRYLGINEPMANRIGKQFAEHGEKIDGVHVANTERWTDAEAVRAFRAAVNKDIDTQVVTRSVADIPLFANTPLGRLLFQFNSFNLASHQRVLLRGLQEGPARFVQGAVAITTLGMLTTWLKAKAANRDVPDIAQNPGWWIAEGIDQGGLFMVPMQMANAFEKLVGINPIKAPIKAFDETAAQSLRLHNRGVASFIGGPSAGLIEDISTLAHIPTRLIAGEDISAGQKNAAERLLPFNSYLGLRQMMRYLVNPNQAD